VQPRPGIIHGCRLDHVAPIMSDRERSAGFYGRRVRLGERLPEDEHPAEAADARLDPR
jgi:hypothetical protein